MLCLLGTTATGTNIDLDILNTNNQPPVHIPAHRCYDQAVTREACGGKVRQGGKAEICNNLMQSLG